MEEVKEKLRAAVGQRLRELDCSLISQGLVDYVMLLESGDRSKEAMKEQLQVFLDENTHVFVEWLFDVRVRLGFMWRHPAQGGHALENVGEVSGEKRKTVSTEVGSTSKSEKEHVEDRPEHKQEGSLKVLDQHAVQKSPVVKERATDKKEEDFHDIEIAQGKERHSQEDHRQESRRKRTAEKMDYDYGSRRRDEGRRDDRYKREPENRRRRNESESRHDHRAATDRKFGKVVPGAENGKSRQVFSSRSDHAIKTRLSDESRNGASGSTSAPTLKSRVVVKKRDDEPPAIISKFYSTSPIFERRVSKRASQLTDPQENVEVGIEDVVQSVVHKRVAPVQTIFTVTLNRKRKSTSAEDVERDKEEHRRSASVSPKKPKLPEESEPVSTIQNDATPDEDHEQIEQQSAWDGTIDLDDSSDDEVAIDDLIAKAQQQNTQHPSGSLPATAQQSNSDVVVTKLVIAQPKQPKSSTSSHVRNNKVPASSQPARAQQSNSDVVVTKVVIARPKPTPVPTRPQDPRKKVRCMNWPDCPFDLMCHFHHPTTVCRNYPHCLHGANCFFAHPPCEFKSACTRRNCIKVHSQTGNYPPVVLRTVDECIEAGINVYDPRIEAIVGVRRDRWDMTPRYDYL
ncbi:unnamed protein product, partial [Mesorhabditis spiculigera]